MPHSDESLLVSGRRLDRYELVCPLAQGGMAEVWVARMRGKRGFEKLVAVKTVLARLSDDPRAQRMFLDEARIIADIHHPNVAGILDLGEEDELLYLVLEYVDGDSLAVLRRALQDAGEPFPLALALRVISNTCLGLHAAHTLERDDGTAAPVVHRDVSPQNVLVSRAGAVKVIDFGIAKILDSADETAHGQIKGKVWYMAPEQALFQDVDPRTDVWGAGAVLHHLLSGKPPYPASTEAESYSMLCAGEPPERLSGVPDVVADIVARALAYEPRDRFQSADEMHRALEDAIVETCGAAPTSVVERAVEEWLGERLSERRRRIRSAIENLGGAGVWDLSVSPGLDDEAPTHVLGSDEPAVLAPRPAIVAATPAAPPRSSAWVGIALGSALFAVGIIGALALRRPDPAPAAAPPRAVVEPAREAPMLPSAPAVPAVSAADQQQNGTDAAAEASAGASVAPAPRRPVPRPVVPRGGKSPKSPLDVFGEKRK